MMSEHMFALSPRYPTRRLRPGRCDVTEREVAGLHVRESGRGTPVILVHAFPCDGRLYEAQVDASFEGFRIVVPDLPGFGRSPAREMASVDDYADAILELADAEGADRFVAGGTSMGGYVTMALLRT